MIRKLDGHQLIARLPTVAGKLTPEKLMEKITWMRVGGPAEVFFQPADINDLSQFLYNLPSEIDVLTIGACSNLIVRDGGIKGVVIKLGKAFSDISFDGNFVSVGAAALDSKIAEKSAEHGLDLSFLRTIPGSIGGAVKMNAGCYGSCLADVFESADVVLRSGELKTLHSQDLGFSYRSAALPSESTVVRVKLKPKRKNAEKIISRMRLNQSKRLNTQPVKERTCGSTFRNPLNTSLSTLTNSPEKAWELIDGANLRGYTIGGAMVSKLHSNFLINTGSAKANDVERLGEFIQEKVMEKSGVKLDWEVKRVGIRVDN